MPDNTSGLSTKLLVKSLNKTTQEGSVTPRHTVRTSCCLDNTLGLSASGRLHPWGGCDGSSILPSPILFVRSVNPRHFVALASQPHSLRFTFFRLFFSEKSVITCAFSQYCRLFPQASLKQKHDCQSATSSSCQKSAFQDALQ